VQSRCNGLWNPYPGGGDRQAKESLGWDGFDDGLIRLRCAAGDPEHNSPDPPASVDRFPREQLFYLTPKIGIVSQPNFNLAVGALALQFGFADESDDPSAGIVYTVGTVGGEKGSFTAGVGYGYAGGELADSPAIMLGRDNRISPRFGFVTENYFFPGLSDNALVSLGGRFFGEKLAVDFGLVTALGSEGSGVVPFVGFVANF